MSRLSICSLPAIVALFLTPGCAPQVATTQVAGQVTYQEKPVAGGVVNFFPAAGGRPLAGIINKAGNYQAELPAGNYNITVQRSSPMPEGYREGDPPPPPDPNALPSRFSLPRTSGLSATILKQSEPQTLDFSLK